VIYVRLLGWPFPALMYVPPRGSISRFQDLSRAHGNADTAHAGLKEQSALAEAAEDLTVV